MIVHVEPLSASATKDLPLTYYTNENVVTDKIMEWLDKCSRNHDCQVDLSKPLPTRVIDVGTVDSQPRLYLTTDCETGQYLALSYCWGDPQKSATTSKNLLESVKSMGIELLLQTIQDAIQVTRKLGFRYLWVDALCIMQDRPSDKAIEIESMGIIYQNAIATIAAVSAASADCGFLRVVNKNHIRFTLAEQCNSYSHIAIMDPRVVEWEGGPLESRAWAFQEAILSLRMIFYDSRGYVWTHCYSQKLQPILEDNWKSPPILRWLRPISKWMERSPEPLLGSSQSYKMGGFEIWKTIVEEFSGRCLTDREDRLPALAGIASQLHQSWNDEYLAGAWRSFLVPMLGWHLDPKHAPHFSESPRLPPTWSWTSVSGKIDLPSFDTDAEILDCYAKSLQWGAPFGKVKMGLVKLRAVVLDLPIDYDRLQVVDGTMDLILDDLTNSLVGGNGIKLVHLGSNLRGYSSYGIIIEPGESNSYKRIGGFVLRLHEPKAKVVQVRSMFEETPINLEDLNPHPTWPKIWKSASVTTLTIV